MNKQYVKGYKDGKNIYYEQAVCKRIQRRKKPYLIMIEKQTAITGTKDDVFTIQRSEAKKNEKVFPGLSSDNP